MTKYEYSPLNEDAQEIRILKLLPGSFSDDMRLSLTITTFTEKNVSDFEALSYTWGSPESPSDILVGEQGNYTLHVTRNLAEALHYLRHQDKPRTLWINEICVNQQDMRERSSQVKRMAEIYSKAHRVIVWLGKDSIDSPLALECLATLSSQVKVEWNLGSLIPLSDDLHWAVKGDELPFSDKECAAIANLLNRSWFQRLWIWQEVRLAEHVTVVCGTRSFSWSWIQVMAFCLTIKQFQPSFYNNISKNHRNLLHNLCRPFHRSSFQKLVDETKYCLCTDPRDRIFALLSMLTDFEFQAKPDYTKDTLEVYKDFMAQHIKAQGSLDLLTTIEHHDHLGKGLPSWVADWSSPRTTVPLGETRASSCSVCPVNFKNNATLEVTGMTVATVSTVERCHLPELGAISYYDTGSELVRMAGTMKFRDDVEWNPRQIQNLCSALCSDSFADDHFAESATPGGGSMPSFRQGEDFLRRLLVPEETSFYPSQIDDFYLSYVRHFLIGRSLFMTTGRNIGMAPKETEPGDVIVVLLGCNSAMILRPLRSGNYRLVGEAFYDGVMYGEAIIGPLLKPFRRLRRYIESSQLYFESYLNCDSGMIQVEDPRLKGIPLPPGWRRMDWKQKEFQEWFVNDETGKILITAILD